MPDARQVFCFFAVTETSMLFALHLLSVGMFSIASALSPTPAGHSADSPETPGKPKSIVLKGGAAETPASIAQQVQNVMAEAAEAEVAGASAANASGEVLDLLWPVETRTISSAWGPRVRTMTMVVKTPKGSRRVRRAYDGAHKGIDFTAPKGSSVFAATDGRVADVGRSKKLGCFVVIYHGNGVETVYGHNSANLVSPGDTVRRGQVIAKVGSTGHSTGPHVHFEVRVDGRQVNPMPMINDTEMISAEMTEHNERLLSSVRP
jgi:murein DD-endopeptidase MepM/ murein hydrolase activator NlpD